MEQFHLNYLDMNRSLFLIIKRKVLFLTLLYVSISNITFAQSSLKESSWSLDTLELKEVTRTRAEVPTKYIEVKEILDCIFQKIELKEDNKCILWDYFEHSLNGSYSLTDSELIIMNDNKEIIYKYTVSDSKLILRRNFKAGNVSGVLVEYNIMLQFSLFN